jgi:hypothetical protein
MAKRTAKKDAVLIDESVIRANRIKTVVYENYSDMGIYRWLNRNKTWLKWLFGIGIPVTTIIAIVGTSWPVAITGISFIALAWSGAIDHFWIGLRFRRALNKLEDEGVFTSLPELLDICKEDLPK